MKEIDKIKKELTDLIEKGNAHVSLEKLFDKIPFNQVMERPYGLPYGIWNLTEHIRLAQVDIIEFMTNPDYIEPNWPEDYWPNDQLPTEKRWEECKSQILKDKKRFAELIKKSDMDQLFAPIEKGTGQTVFKEALVVADHNSYHTGQILVLMRLLGLWG